MAGDDDRDWVRPHGLAHRPGRTGPPHPRREPPVGNCCSVRNPRELAPHRPLERGPAEEERKVERRARSAQVLPELAAEPLLERARGQKLPRWKPGEPQRDEVLPLRGGVELPPRGGDRRPTHGASVATTFRRDNSALARRVPVRTMPPMRVLALGWEVEGPGVIRAEFASADSLASYDAVLVDPEPLPSLWLPHAALEPDGVWRLHPGRDLGLSRALGNLVAARRAEVEDLLLRGGGVLVVRVRPPGEGVEIAGQPPHRLDRYAFLPRTSLVSGPHHLGLPQGLRFVPRRGHDLTTIEAAHPAGPYLEAFAPLGYEAVLVATLGAPLSSFGKVLATNRVGDAVAWDLPVGAGRILFLPSLPGASPSEVGERLLPVVAALCGEPLPVELPDWISGFELPGEDELRRAEEALARDREKLRRREQELGEARRGYDLLRALLSPRGHLGLAQATWSALERLGFTVSPRGDAPATAIASSSDGDYLVRAALSPFGPVGPEEHRALLLDLDRLRSEENADVRGLLVCLADPRLDPRRRGPQWAESVRRGCRDHGLVLTSAHNLFRAVRDVLGGGSAAEVRRDLLAAEGEWRWKG